MTLTPANARSRLGQLGALLNTNAARAIGVMLFVFAMAIGSNFELMFKVGWAIFGAVMLSFLWAHLSLVGLRLERETRTGRTQVGDVAEERFALLSRFGLPRLWIEVHDLSDLPGYRASHIVNFLGERRRGWRVRTICRQRG